MTPAQQRQQALQTVNAALAPEIQANKAAQAQATTDATNHSLAIQGFYNALGDAQKPVAGNIEQTYADASTRQAAFGKGFSDALQHIQNSTADQSNALLAQNGQAARLSPGTGAADALYATGGLIPASVLNNAGAAFSAAAQGLPGQAKATGAQSATAALFQGQDAKKKLADDLLLTLGKKPSLIDQALQSIRGEQQQNYANAIQSNYLNNTLRSTGANITGVDPVTGQPTADAVAAATAASTKKAEKRAAAVGKRDDATVQALVDGRTWAEAQLKPGNVPVKVADQPIQIGQTQAVKDPKSGKIIVDSKPIYAKKGGGQTTDMAEAATKSVFDQQPLPKPEFNKLFRKLTGQLTVQLRRYGYKPAQIKGFAMDILDDYYVMVQDLPPQPGQTRTTKTTKHGTTTNTTSTGP